MSPAALPSPDQAQATYAYVASFVYSTNKISQYLYWLRNFFSLARSVDYGGDVRLVFNAQFHLFLSDSARNLRS